jgi:hypothetical protein
MTNDEFKMTKETRMTEEGRAGSGAFHRAAASSWSGGRFSCFAALIIDSSFVIRHSSFCLFKT